MNKKQVEIVVDKSIPYLLALLAFVLTIEFFFREVAKEHHTLILFIDGFIISVFIIDLLFKYQHMHTFMPFLRKYWLEILAVLPFFLVFRIIEEFGLLRRAVSETTHTTQALLHLGSGVEREAAALSRSQQLQEFIRPFLRLPRFLKATSFYEAPTK